MYMGFYLWILYPVTLPYFSMCTPIPYSLNYCCFTISTSFSVSPETVFLFQRFGYSRSFAFQYEFLNKSVISIKKKSFLKFWLVLCWIMYQFGENWHLTTVSSDPWTQYISSCIQDFFNFLSTIPYIFQCLGTSHLVLDLSLRTSYFDVLINST